MKRSQYFKIWLGEKRIPVLVIPLILILIVGILVLIIGGTVAGWNIGRALTSKTAALFYVIFVIVSGIIIFDWLSKRNQR